MLKVQVLPEREIDPSITSPGATGYEDVDSATSYPSLTLESPYISYHASYDGDPLMQSVSVPSCSTVSLTAPSIPTHSDAYVVAPDAHVTVGTVQLPATAENVAPVTSYPDQFVDSPSADVTESNAGIVVALPAEFVNVASYSHPFSAEVAVKVYVADVAPEIALQLAPEFVETDHATVGVGVPEAAAEKEAVAPEATVIELGSDVTCGALPPGGVVVVVTGAVTVSVASADVTLPALLENVAWNSSPFSAVDATRKYEDPDPPGSGTHVVPPSLETSHVSLGVGTPVAVEVKVTGVPAVTVTLAGSVVTTGATADAPTVSVAAVETAAPRRFVNTARTRRPESVVSATIE
jgi:hypothetical protein